MTTTMESVPARAEPVAPVPLVARAPARHRGPALVRRVLLAADLLGLVVAYAVATGAGGLATDELVAFLAIVPLWVVGAKLFGLYGADEQRIDHSTVDEIVAVVLLDTVASWTLVAAAYLAGRLDTLAGDVVLFWLVALGAVVTVRSVTRALVRRRPSFRQRALILGADETGLLVARKLRQHPEYGVDVVGFADDRANPEIETIGAATELPELVRTLGIERVIVTSGRRSPEETLAAIRSLGALDVYVDLVPHLYEIVGPSGRIHSIEGLPLIDLPPVRLSRSFRLVKRTIDVAGALVGLVLSLPLFLVVPLLIRRESPGPALFRQTRLGEQMREFTVLKFRTMRVDADEARHRDFIEATMDASVAPESNGLFKLDRGSEVTRVGAFLRRTSLDELPQLWNVLRGEMSLVGPRPCIPYETQFFRQHHFERFLVPAGLTGLWQVTARAHATFGEALDMDVAYARGWSLGLDLNLLLRTVRHVLTRKGTA